MNNNYKLLKDYHNNYVNYIISKIYGEPFERRPDMVQALGIIASIEDEELRKYAELKFIRNKSLKEITELTGWSYTKQDRLKRALLEV